MPRGTGLLGTTLALALCATPWAPALATDGSTGEPRLSERSLAACERGRDTEDHTARAAAFEEGLALAERAVALNDDSAAAHFALFCNKGELLRLDGERLSAFGQFRTVMRSLDRTLAIDPTHLKAMASKGILLVRLPRLLGGNAAAGERLLLQVVERDPNALTSRLVLAERCRDRGDLSEARDYAGRALEIANAQGRSDKVHEAQLILAKIDSAR